MTLHHCSDEVRFSTRDAAAFLGCAPTTLKISRINGVLFGREAPKYRKLGRRVVYDRTELAAWLEQFDVLRHTAEKTQHRPSNTPQPTSAPK